MANMEKKPFNWDSLAVKTIQGANIGALSGIIMRKNIGLFATTFGLGHAVENLVMQHYTLKTDVVSTGIGGFVFGATYTGFEARCDKTALARGMLIGPFASLVYAGTKYYAAILERAWEREWEKRKQSETDY